MTSDLTRTSDKSFTWTINDVQNSYSFKSSKFKLENDDIEWFLSLVYDENKLFSHFKLDAFQFYLVRDYPEKTNDDEDGWQWEVQVDYRMSALGMKGMNVSNFYPKNKKDDGINYLKPIRIFFNNSDSASSDVSEEISPLIINFDILNFNINKILDFQSKVVRHVAGSMTKFLEDKRFADLTIVVDGEELKAHKMVLAAHSQVFETMFTQDMIEKKTNRVEIKDISADVFKAFLKYIYFGQFSEFADQCDQLIAVADKYQVELLKKLCEEHLIKTITIDNCINLLKIGDLYSSKKLAEAAVDFISKRRSDWDKIDSFNDFLLKHPKLMLMILMEGQKSAKSKGKKAK